MAYLLLLKGAGWRRSLMLAAFVQATAGQAATCFNHTKEDAAEIYCTARGGEDEDCTYLWQLTMADGSVIPWRGSFEVKSGEVNVLKDQRKGVLAASGNINYKCSTISSLIGNGSVGDVNSDAADHFTQLNEARDQNRSLHVASIARKRLHAPCSSVKYSANSALRANHLPGYDEGTTTRCGGSGF